ncbi:MAG TPA: beta-ketoacyl synthase N-terminal-like domain-containing protein [Bacteroidia bacterium]|jgi:3-oxoacyl-(acyl-carrier-protein) synthase
MEAYIKGIGIISPQKTFDTQDFLSDVVKYDTNSLRCIEPSYKDFLNPTLARRMGRVIKMGIAASSICFKDSGVAMPDAIMTGTALGCLEDTEKFLLAIIDNDEQFLTPTSFVQSTHNTVSAQIALQLKCMNYNFTYVHKGFSFESSVLDGLMTIAEGNGNNILVGGHDEMTDKYYRVCDRVGYWKKEATPTMALLESNTDGSIAGEGAAFFMLSNEKSDKNYAKLRSLKFIYKPENQQEIEHRLNEMLSEKGLKAEDIDLVIYGINGDARYDGVYHQLKDNYFPAADAAYFKHLCGEYQTAGSFAMWVAAMAIKTQTIPEAVLIGSRKKRQIKNVLIYNSFMGTDHAAFLLSQC